MAYERFYIKEWYDSLSTPQKRNIKSDFCQTFKVANSTFAYAINNQEIQASRILWFARMLHVNVDDLTYPPSITVRPMKPEKGQKKIAFNSKTL